jgi:hypothetical protein
MCIDTSRVKWHGTFLFAASRFSVKRVVRMPSPRHSPQVSQVHGLRGHHSVCGSIAVESRTGRKQRHLFPGGRCARGHVDLQHARLHDHPPKVRVQHHELSPDKVGRHSIQTSAVLGPAQCGGHCMVSIHSYGSGDCRWARSGRARC